MWNILKCSENELIKKMYNAQKVASIRNDWFKLLESERQKYDIVQTDDQISKMSKYQFKYVNESYQSCIRIFKREGSISQSHIV